MALSGVGGVSFTEKSWGNRRGSALSTDVGVREREPPPGPDEAVQGLEGQVQGPVPLYLSVPVDDQQLMVQQSFTQRLLQPKVVVRSIKGRGSWEPSSAGGERGSLTNESLTGCLISVAVPPHLYSEKVEVSPMLKEYGPVGGGEGGVSKGSGTGARHQSDHHSPRYLISTGSGLLSSVMPWTSEKKTLAPSWNLCRRSSTQSTTPGLSCQKAHGDGLQIGEEASWQPNTGFRGTCYL